MVANVPFMKNSSYSDASVLKITLVMYVNNVSSFFPKFTSFFLGPAELRFIQCVCNLQFSSAALVTFT